MTTWRTLLFDEAAQVGAAEYTFDGTHRYHGVALVKLRDGRVTHWREYQHVDGRAWEDYASGTAW